jgi:hypothetical protein
VPGAIGAFRRDTLTDVGGVPTVTLAEDTDLTMAILRAGWRAIYANPPPPGPKRMAGHTHVIIDGTLIETDRCRTPGPTPGVDLWWSGKHHTHGGNIQVVSGPDGWPLHRCAPGREHDTTALRRHAEILPLLTTRHHYLARKASLCPHRSHYQEEKSVASASYRGLSTCRIEGPQSQVSRPCPKHTEGLPR